MNDTYAAIDARVARAIVASRQKKVYVDYSAYELDDDDNPIDNLDEVAARGKVILVCPCDPFWGGPKARDYRSPVLDSPTWLEVCVIANRMIRRTRDLHHVFLEGLQYRKKEGDVKIFEFCMGS